MIFVQKWDDSIVKKWRGTNDEKEILTTYRDDTSRINTFVGVFHQNSLFYFWYKKRVPGVCDTIKTNSDSIVCRLICVWYSLLRTFLACTTYLNNRIDGVCYNDGVKTILRCGKIVIVYMPM